ncbi:MAG: DUF3579 domain-containing protein [Gammaproteobacteria bacterium]|nr:DUF3579 domain-containing protein [Gammaproteobacteria bacterium]
MQFSSDSTNLIITGVQDNNSKFRPSDWAERLSSLWAEFGRDQKLRYSSKIYPCMIGDDVCLIVAKSLGQQDPSGYEFILNFARENQLKIQEDRRENSSPTSNEQRKNDWNYNHFIPNH